MEEQLVIQFVVAAEHPETAIAIKNEDDMMVLMVMDAQSPVCTLKLSQNFDCNPKKNLIFNLQLQNRITKTIHL